MNSLGLFSWFGHRMPFGERIHAIARAGFDATCLWLGPEEELVAAAKADVMPGIVHDAGLYLDNVHAPYEDCNSIWSDSAGDRDRIRRVYSDGLAYCARHEVPIMVAHVSRSATPPPCNETGLRLLAELVKRAEDLGVTLALENTGSPRHVESILEQIDSPHLGFCYDSSHDALNRAPFARILATWGHRLVTTHLSDNQGEADNHYLPGEGSIDWNLVSRSFPSDTYRGTLMLEVVPTSSDTAPPDEFLARAFQSASRLRDMLTKRPAR